MDASPLASVFGVLNKLQGKIASAPSSSRPLDLPELKQLNDMVYEVHSPPPNTKPDLEVVFFHGLQWRPSEDAHITTWMSRDNSQLWLQTWLVELFPKARIFTISYDSSAQRTRQRGRLDMYRTGENLVNSLVADDVRLGQAGCPVVLVGHCLGGLVLKELCLTAAWMLSRKDPKLFRIQKIDDLVSNLRGMFFYGTPHAGSFLGDELRHHFKGELLAEIETLKTSSARRNADFCDLQARHKWVTSGIGEASETYVEYLGRSVHMVPEASTRPFMDSYYTAAGDHYEICKPERKNDTSFKRLKDFLHELQTDEGLRSQTLAPGQTNPEYFIDLEGRAKQVQDMLAQPDTHTVFIPGLSGIGKTALAQQVFHDIKHQFSRSCFVSLDSLEGSSNPGQEASQKIQHALEADSSRGSNHNHFRGLGYLIRKKVLMVLDNVDSEDQLRVLQLETWLEGSGSKLIVTTTNGRLGTPNNTFLVPYLSYEEFQKIFSHYTFKDKCQPQRLRSVIQDVIEECERFPLPLRILGGYISKEDVDDKNLWMELLDRLQKAQEVDSGHDYRLMAKLRLCYDVLQPPEKEIFLDIACLFHGQPISKVDCFWRGCWESSHLALANLQRRFLAQVDNVGDIRMHKLLRNLGHNICNPSRSSVDKWRRISTPSSVRRLITKHQGMVDAQAVEFRTVKNEIITLRNTTFVNFVNLEYLMLDGVRMSSRRVELPTSLVFLRWKDGLFTSCPLDFSRFGNLTVLELVNCKSMKCLPPSVVNARKLLWLELEGCVSLTELPLGLPRALEYLGLSKTSIRVLPSDIWKVKGLKHLLADRTQLTRIPVGVGRLEMLSSLNLRGCRVATLPESFGGLTGLRELDLSHTMLTSLPESIGRLQGLRKLHLGGTKMKRLPESLGDVAQLEVLVLSGSSIETLPKSFCRLGCLSVLDLDSSGLVELPDGMGELVALRDLFLLKSRLDLGCMTSMPPCLETLCMDLVYLSVTPVFSWESGHSGGQGQENTLGLRDGGSQVTEYLFQVEDFPFLHGVSDLRLGGEDCPQAFLQPLFVALQGMPSLSSLSLFAFNLCDRMPPELGLLTELQYLGLQGWQRLQELPESVGELPRLDTLVLHYLPELCKLPEFLRASNSLVEVVISQCKSLPGRPGSFNRASLLDNDSCFSEGRKSGPLDIPRPAFTIGRRQLKSVRSDSFEVLEFLLGCCGNYTSSSTVYIVECEEMAKVLRKAAATEDRHWVIDSKVAMELISERDLNFRASGSDPLGFRRFCSSHPSSHPCLGCLWRHFKIVCQDWQVCALHSRQVVRVTDVQEEIGELDEQDNVMDQNEERGEDAEVGRSGALVAKHLLRPLFLFGFSCFFVWFLLDYCC